MLERNALKGAAECNWCHIPSLHSLMTLCLGLIRVLPFVFCVVRIIVYKVIINLNS